MGTEHPPYQPPAKLAETCTAIMAYFTKWIENLDSHYTRWISDHEKLTLEHDRRIDEKFDAAEEARKLALVNLEDKLQNMTGQIPTAADHMSLANKVEELEQRTIQMPSPTDHKLLEARVTSLEEVKNIQTGKTSQSSVQTLLIISMIGILISLCIGLTSVATLILHILKII